MSLGSSKPSMESVSTTGRCTKHNRSSLKQGTEGTRVVSWGRYESSPRLRRPSRCYARPEPANFYEHPLAVIKIPYHVFFFCLLIDVSVAVQSVITLAKLQAMGSIDSEEDPLSTSASLHSQRSFLEADWKITQPLRHRILLPVFRCSS